MTPIPLLRPRPGSGLRRRGALALPVAAWLGGLCSTSQAAGPVLLGGTGSGVAVLRRVLDGQATPLSVVPNLGSGGGLKALAAGRLDLAIASRRPNEAERAAGLVEREVFRSPLVWAVNHDVPVRQATRAELVALYEGRRATWPNGQPVRLVLRPESDIDTQLLRALGPEMDAAVSAASRRPGMTVALTDDEVALDIERIPGALGTVTLGLVRAQDHTLPMLKVSDLPASAAALADGRYPLVKRFYLVTRARTTPEVAAVLQAVASRAAAERLAGLGCQAVGTA